MTNGPQNSGSQPQSWKPNLRIALLAIVVFVGSLAVYGYYRARDIDRDSGSSAAERLQEVTASASSDTVGRTVYVPVYSSLPLGLDIKQNAVQLSSTVSIRNVSPRYAVVLEFVRYYDSTGRLVREHLQKPAELGPLASVEFVVRRSDTSGGPGANFLVRWAGPAAIDEPLIEAVMLGRYGDAGISFTSPGRSISNDTPP
jgi:hypothetical protein